MEKVKRKKIIIASVWTSILILVVLLFSLLYVFVWKVPTYKITLSNNIGMENILQGGGEYSEGDEVFIMASKVPGYTFLNWTFNDEVVSEDYSFAFKISSQNYGEYVANYSQRDFLIKKSCSGGDVEVQNSAKAGDSVAITGIVAEAGFKLSELYYCEYGKEEKVEIENNMFVMPANNVTIFAIFSEIEFDIDVESYSNGNIIVSQESAIVGQEVEIFVDVMGGYEVTRIYYLSEDGQSEIEIEGDKFVMPPHSVKIFAEIQLATYDIKYNLNGGQAEGFVYSYNIYTQSIEVPNPTREGWTFLGWIGGNLTYATKDLVIGTGTWGDLEFSALWEQNS